MPERSVSHALDASLAVQTQLGRALVPQLAQHAGLSGIQSLPNPLEAFAARMLLARSAERTLDVQYYIWRADQTGTLLLQALVAAADRGVRVRLLLDDGGTNGLDTVLAALALHPNIEVRLFNPFPTRKFKKLGYVTDFSRTNRRMHNKSFTADNQVSILGGRNVGDEYFGATEAVLFSDMDVMTVGSVVPEVSNDFDRYWASPSAYPVQAILPSVTANELQVLHAKASGIEQSEAAQLFTQTVGKTRFIRQLLEQQLPMEWAPTTLVSDDPLKGLGQAQRQDLLIHQLDLVIGKPERSLALVSPYFVPTKAGVAAFTQLRKNGIRVSVLTNSYEATDVPLVHAGYAKHRKALLEQGVELYEMQRMAPPSSHRRLNPLGSSGSSLHAKTFAVDGTRAFVGSFNFDPRSALLNTELGVIIDSPVIAQQIAQAFDKDIPSRSYQVGLSNSGALQWQLLPEPGTDAPPTILTVEPGTSMTSRSLVRVLSLLPIDWLL